MPLYSVTEGFPHTAVTTVDSFNQSSLYSHPHRLHSPTGALLTMGELLMLYSTYGWAHSNLSSPRTQSRAVMRHDFKLGVVIHAFNPNKEAESSRSEFEGSMVYEGEFQTTSF